MIAVLCWTAVGALCGHPVTGLAVGLLLSFVAAVIDQTR